MGMTRAVGLGFLLLLVVTHAAIPNRRPNFTGDKISSEETVNRRMESLKLNEYYLTSDVTTITDVKVGDRLYLFADRKSTGSRLFPDRTLSSQTLRIGDVEVFFTCENDSVPNVYRLEVIPTKPGSHTLKISPQSILLNRGATPNDPTAKTVTFSVLQGSTVFFTEEEPSNTMEVEILRNTALTVYAENAPTEKYWSVDSSLNVVTTSIVEVTGIPENTPYFENRRYGFPLRTFSATPTTTDCSSSPCTVTLKLKKKSDHSVEVTHTINIKVK